MIQAAAIRTNKLLLNVIQNLPPPAESLPRGLAENVTPSRTVPVSPTPTAATSAVSSRASTLGKDASINKEESSLENSSDTPTQIPVPRSRMNVPEATPRALISDMPPPPLPPSVAASRPISPMTSTGVSTVSMGIMQALPASPEENDPFDYQATVNELTVQFLSEYEETRVAALKWLIMLHQKAPKKVIFMF
jgi:vacuole morphology and inheritance protein 14